ncbi:MAG: nucleotidyl transferase AbiEii/AbiGii toxin family protein [Acetobacteraceae bacterium]
MATPFTPRLDILPPPQRRLWSELGSVPRGFVLYGGTAVALHLGHRQSADFDFFGDRPLDPTKLVPAIPFLAGATVTHREPNTFSCIVERGGPVKLSFFGLPEIPRLSPPLIAPDNGVEVASLLDLAGMKASVVQMRAEAKDYLDIDAILTDGRIDLPAALAAARAIYGQQFNPLATLKALSYFADGDLDRLSRPVRDRLAHAAGAVDLDRLPSIAAP